MRVAARIQREIPEETHDVRLIFAKLSVAQRSSLAELCNAIVRLIRPFGTGSANGSRREHGELWPNKKAPRASMGCCAVEEDACLTADDFRRIQPLGGVAAVNQQLRAADDIGVIVAGVVGNDYHTIVFADGVERGARQLKIVFSSPAHEREIRIVIT